MQNGQKWLIGLVTRQTRSRNCLGFQSYRTAKVRSPFLMEIMLIIMRRIVLEITSASNILEAMSEANHDWCCTRWLEWSELMCSKRANSMFLYANVWITEWYWRKEQTDTQTHRHHSNDTAMWTMTPSEAAHISTSHFLIEKQRRSQWNVERVR